MRFLFYFLLFLFVNMFQFYGAKKSYVDKYPPPRHKVIIEPFAGSASYSMKYCNHNVILCELDEIIYGIWKYLIHKATKKSILSLPLLQPEEKLSDSRFNNLLPCEKHLIGYHIQYGACKGLSQSRFGHWNENTRKQIADNLCKIRHWKVYNCSYNEINNTTFKATWFIDPPYSGKGGLVYRKNNKTIDYKQLANWCKERNGQIIVCENEESTGWLPFKPLHGCSQAGRKHTEMVYTR